MTGGLLVVTSIALALGTFMQVLDSSIANVAVPTIAGDMGVSSDQGTYVITAFAAANGISVPLTGWLMMRYGLVKTFVWSVILFTVASFLCGISWNLPSLIIFRVLQGGVSGPMIPGSQALLISIFPSNQRGAALAIWSMTTLVAPITGPVLGGYICDNMTWQWIFLINVPIGAACAWLCWRNMKSRETPTRKLPIDKTGFMLLTIWVGCFQVMLDTGKDADWFSSPTIVALALIAAIGCVAWVIWEFTDKTPIVNLSLFRNSNFTLGCIVTCLGYAVFFGANVLQPLWLQTRMNYIATWAGLVAAPSGVVAVVLTPIAARVMAKIDARWTATVAMGAFFISFWMRSGYNTDASFSALMAPMLVQGVAMSVFFVSMITITLNGVPVSQLPQATGLSNFTRLTAGAFAAALSTTVWDRSEAMHQTRLSEVVSSTDPNMTKALGALGHAGMSTPQSVASMTQQFVNQAYLLATVDFFRVCAWLMLLMIPLLWLTKRAGGGGGHAVAAD
jgi:DHA2 family multidrug resistance protein